jgi:hypothetical protein
MGEYFTPEMYREVLRVNCIDQRAFRFHAIRTFHPDNWGYWDWDKWTWKPPGLAYVQDVLGRYHGSRRARYLEGRPASLENVVFPEFGKQHIRKPFEVPKEWPCILAKDPGRDHPDATLVVAVAPAYVDIRGRDGKVTRINKLYVVDEIITGNSSEYGRSTNIEEDARAIDKRLSPRYRIVRKLGDPHMMFSETKFSPNGLTIAQQMAAFGHVFEPAPAARNQAEIAAQCDLIRTRLTTLDNMGEPMLTVFEGCKATIQGFQTWGYKRNAKGEMNGGEDAFEDIGDDEMDALRMIVATNPVFATPAVRVVSYR